MRRKEMPLDESKSILSSIFGNEYFPAFESEEGYLRPDLEGEESEELKDVLYTVLERNQTVELARGKSNAVSYTIEVGPDGEDAPYELNVQVNPTFSLSRLSDPKSFLGYNVENKLDLEEIEEIEKEFEEDLRDNISQLKGRNGLIEDAKFSHFTYSRLLKEDDISNPEELLEEAGKVASEAFNYYSEFIKEESKEGKRDDRLNKHRATSIFHPES